MATFLQGLLRNRELAEWWRAFGAAGFERETFRLTYTVPTSYSNEGTFETNTLPKDTYARNSRLLEACESNGFRTFAETMAEAVKSPVPAKQLEQVVSEIPGVGPFLSTCILEAAEGARLLQDFDGDTFCFGTNTHAYLRLIAPTHHPEATLLRLTKKVREVLPREKKWRSLACPRIVQRSCCKLLQLLKCIKTGQLKNCRRVRIKIRPWIFSL
jgi:hypothetical protein